MGKPDIDISFYLKMIHTTMPLMNIVINMMIVKREYLSAVLSIKTNIHRDHAAGKFLVWQKRGSFQPVKNQ